MTKRGHTYYANLLSDIKVKLMQDEIERAASAQGKALAQADRWREQALANAKAHWPQGTWRQLSEAQRFGQVAIETLRIIAGNHREADPFVLFASYVLQSFPTDILA